ncbi:minor capsid protein [bacterium]|nr:minor capsid protein [bacterium]
MGVSVKLNWYGDQVTREVKEAAAEGLLLGAEYLLEESNRVVPHNEGTLQRSGETSVDDEKLEANVSYDTPYAARLHEHPEYKFQNGRIGKWLEVTLKKCESEVAKIIAGPIKRVLGG